MVMPQCRRPAAVSRGAASSSRRPPSTRRTWRRGATSVNSLHLARGPPHRQRPDALARPEREGQRLRVLREEARARLHDLRLGQPLGLDHDPGADRIAVALARAGQPKAEPRLRGADLVAEDAQLRRLPRRHDREILIAVAIDVEDRERAPVLIEVEAGGAGDLVEAALAVVAQQHVALAAGDRLVDQQLVDRPPRLVVRRALHRRERRLRHHLPPEEPVQIGIGAREHPVGDVEIVPAVAVEVERVGRPRPAADVGAGLQRGVLEAAVAQVAIEAVAAGVLSIVGAHLGGRAGHERRRRGDAQAVGGPHVAGIDVEAAVVVVVEERRAHAGTVVEDAGLRRDVLEADRAAARAEVAIQVLDAEVVGDEQVGPAVLVVVGPRRGEVVAIVAGVEPGGLGGVDEAALAVVVEQHARRAVARVVVRHRRAGLLLAGAEEVGIDAEIDVEEAVAIVVGHRQAGEDALQRRVEAERAGDRREAALAVVGEQQRLRAGGQHQILIAVVVDVGEQRLRGVVEDADAGAIGRRPRRCRRRGRGTAGWAGRPAARRRDPRGRRRRRRRPTRRGVRSSRASARRRASSSRRRAACSADGGTTRCRRWRRR